MLETIARSLGFATGAELERDIDKTRRARRRALRVAHEGRARASRPDAAERAALRAIDAGEEALVLAAIADGVGRLSGEPALRPISRAISSRSRAGPTFRSGRARATAIPSSRARCSRRSSTRPIPSRRRVSSPRSSRGSRPRASTRARWRTIRACSRRLVGLFGASAFLGEALVVPPRARRQRPLRARADARSRGRRRRRALHDRQPRKLGAQRAAEADDDPTEAFVGALRRAKARVTMEVGLADLAGELGTRDATLVLSALADATLEHATRRALVGARG